MASDIDYMSYIAEQVKEAGQITYRKMFGEYALYCDRKVVALVCDNQLFVKPTNAGRQFIGEPQEHPAYKGAKPSFLIEDRIDDKEWLTELIYLTAKELPLPKPKKKKTQEL
ncbi:TfoX/Sxy family protein [Spirochaeta cellobiosiphila]|uniref:TfoX/Sxy family protein n=1 Tax=Spirochaeta cellobiosiphila TaxID=504483 RepID=UPI0003F689A1|nr:TfoX/Sxy family protein [Spirochaeta cellobiosiphila]